MTSRRVAIAPLLALVTGVVIAPACKSQPPVSFAIAVTHDIAAQTVWFEIGAFRGSRCEGVAPMLKNGVPESASTRLAFRRDGEAPSSLGDLEDGSYAFAAVARAEDCGVLASGCTEVDVEDTRSVTVPMIATSPPSGACEADAVCKAAHCVPANDVMNPGIGAQCSLELLGAGPLANPVGGGGTTVSAPAIAVTPTGFVIVYREIDPNGSSARVTILPIDPAGGALEPTRPLLNGRCPTSEETDGVGVVMNGSDGQVVLARSACGAQPGLELLSFTSKPEVTVDPNQFRSSDSPLATKLVLSDARVAARTPGASVIVFNEDGASRIATIVPGTGVVAPSGTFGGTANMTGAWVAATDQVLAVLSSGPAGASDAGTEPSSQLGLVLVAASTTPDQFNAPTNKPRPPITFPGSWGAVAALGTRAIVASESSAPDRSLSYRVFDLDRAGSTDPKGISVEGPGAVTTADVAMLDDKAYFAVLKPGSISLHVLARALTTPQPLRTVFFSTEPRIPSVAPVNETGRIAVAATPTRVAVVWTTSKRLTNDNATGGYAVFACTP